MKVVDGLHESTDANVISAFICGSHYVLSTIVNRIELSYLIAEANALEEGLDLFSSSRHLEIILCDTHFCES